MFMLKNFIRQSLTLEPAMSAIPTDNFLFIPPDSFLE